MLEDASQRVRSQREPGHETCGIHLLGETALATDAPNPESAASCFRAALERHEQVMIPLAAQYHLSLANVLEQRQPDLSSEHLRHARKIIAALGMPEATGAARPVCN